MDKLKKDWDGILIAVLVLLLVCFITTLAVAATDTVFADKIAEQNALALSQSMERLLPADRYEVALENDAGEPVAYAAVDGGGETVGYIVSTGVFGYGGTVSVMTAFSDGAVSSIEIVDCAEETPGLGQNAQNESFTGQFAGLTGAPALVKTAPARDNEVQALTGATITSTAVSQAVTDAWEIYEQLR